MTATRSDPAAQTFGDGCAQVPPSAPARSTAWSRTPSRTAASNNPLLTTLVTAVGAVDGLGDTLNGAEGLTVFAPSNGAFAEIPEADLNALLEGGQDGQNSDLYKILAHHVVGASGRPTPWSASRDARRLTR